MFARLARDDRGAAVIELAIILPVLAVLAIGIVDFASALNRKTALQQGVQRAMEKVMQSSASNTEPDTLKTELVCQVNGINDNGSCKSEPVRARDVTVTYRLECGSGGRGGQTTSDAAEFDTFTCDTASARQARYVDVKVTDKYAPMFPMHFAGLDSDGTYHLSATAEMRIQ